MFACSRMRSPISLERRREQPKQEAELPANRSQSEEGATSSLAVGEDTLLMLRGVKSSSHALPLLELLGDSSSRSHELITAAASSRGPSTTEAPARPVSRVAALLGSLHSGRCFSPHPLPATVERLSLQRVGPLDRLTEVGPLDRSREIISGAAGSGRWGGGRSRQRTGRGGGGLRVSESAPTTGSSYSKI